MPSDKAEISVFYNTFEYYKARPMPRDLYTPSDRKTSHFYYMTADQIFQNLKLFSSDLQ